MKCSNCTYYEKGVCYRKGTRVFHSNMICQYFVYRNNSFNKEIMLK